jgi:oligopeptidase B
VTFVRSLFVIALSLAGCMHKFPQDAPGPEKIPHHLTKFNDLRVDNYFWLKDRENPKTISYLEAENIYTEKVLAPVKDLEKILFQEMKTRTKEDDSSVPVKKGPFEYWVKYIPGGQYPIYLRRLRSEANGLDATPTSDQILLDGNARAMGHDFFQSTSPIMSPNHEIMALGFDTKGRRFFDFEFKNLVTGKVLPVKIENVTANLVWAADNETVFFTEQNPETLRAEKIYRLNIKSGKKDLVYFEKDDTFGVSLYQSVSRRFIYISVTSTLTTEIYYLEAKHPERQFQLFLAREREHEYEVQDGVDSFYIVSNWQAKNFRVFQIAQPTSDKSKWKEIIPHRADTLITNLTVFKNHLVVSEKSQGLDQIQIYDRKTLASTLIPFSDQSYTVGVHSAAEYDSQFVRYDYESMRIPETTFDFDMKTLTSKWLKTREVPTYNQELYKTERIWIQGRDGTKIPISLLMNKNLTTNGKNPLFIYGYGAYGVPSDPMFSQTIMSLVDRGFVYAIAHVRGGSELGRKWYDDGRVLNKKNSFDDFIDCTEALVKLKYADPHRVYAYGGSAGGLLMGGVMNQRPDLYRGIVAAVPFVDVMTTMLDDSIPLTTSEYDEWGNPNDKKYYDYIRGYSPYDNVTKKDYPNLLVTTGLHDSQVQYWEPAKWVAKLRELKTDSNVILLKTNMSAGHGGASGRYDSLKERATDFAFVLLIDNMANH